MQQQTFEATHIITRCVWFHRRSEDSWKGRPVLTGCTTLLPTGTEIRLVADYGARFLVAESSGWLAYVDPDDFARA